MSLCPQVLLQAPGVPLMPVPAAFTGRRCQGREGWRMLSTTNDVGNVTGAQAGYTTAVHCVSRHFASGVGDAVTCGPPKTEQISSQRVPWHWLRI